MKLTLFYLAAGAAAALLLRESNHHWLFPAALVALAILDLRLFRMLRSWKLWLFLLLLVAIPVLLVGEKDASWLGVPYNSAMLRLNLLMVERSLVLMLTIRLFTSRLSPQTISAALARLHLRQFDLVFRHAQAMLPEVRSTVTASLREVEWRQLARRPDGVIHLLGQLVARLIHAARRRQSAAPAPDEIQ